MFTITCLERSSQISSQEGSFTLVTSSGPSPCLTHQALTIGTCLGSLALAVKILTVLPLAMAFWTRRSIGWTGSPIVDTPDPSTW